MPSGSQAEDEDEMEARAFIVVLWEITAQCNGVRPERVHAKENKTQAYSSYYLLNNTVCECVTIPSKLRASRSTPCSIERTTCEQ